MTIVLADIGGTHIRLARLEGNEIKNPEKLLVGDFPDTQSALTSYCKKPGSILIATAAQPDTGGIFHFTNNEKQILDPAALRGAGWDVKIIVNDFAASARGAIASDRHIVLRKGRADGQSPSAIIGPGTGLGLAYMVPLGNQCWHVQQTFGGHMKAASVTDEHHFIMKLIRRLYGDERTIVYEDVASGRALPVLYQAVCMHNGIQPAYAQAKDMLLHASDAHVKQTLRLFHEFLGLFAHNVVVTGHAFGGLYIDGGVTQRLYEAGLFDFESFAKFMALKVTPIVIDRLETAPVFMINDPFIALRGLAEMVKDGV